MAAVMTSVGKATRWSYFLKSRDVNSRVPCIHRSFRLCRKRQLAFQPHLAVAAAILRTSSDGTPAAMVHR